MLRRGSNSPDPESHDLIGSALRHVVALAERPPVVVRIDEAQTPLDCETVVLDYLDHNEAGLGLEHLIYVVGELDLPISADTYDMISSAASLLEIDPSRLAGIDPNQEPINTLQTLSEVARDTYTLAVKLLNDAYRPREEE